MHPKYSRTQIQKQKRISWKTTFAICLLGFWGFMDMQCKHSSKYHANYEPAMSLCHYMFTVNWLVFVHLFIPSWYINLSINIDPVLCTLNIRICMAYGVPFTIDSLNTNHLTNNFSLNFPDAKLTNLWPRR